MVDTFKDNWYPGAPGNDTTTAGVADGTTATATLSSTPSDTPGSGSLAATPPYDALWESEYVRVTGVNVATKVVTMARGQYGSTGVAHASSARLHHIFTAAGILSLIHSNDYLRQYDAAQGSDAKYWKWGSAAGVYSLYAENDALNTANAALSIGRTGATPSYVQSTVPFAVSASGASGSAAIVTDLALSSSSVAQYGIFAQARGSSSGTTSFAAIYAVPRTAVAGYTVASVYGLWVDDASKGTGSTITTQYGIYVGPQTRGSTTIYGVYIAAPSGIGATTYGLYNAGTTWLNAAVGIGDAPEAWYQLLLAGTASGSPGQAGLILNTAFDATATGGHGIWIDQSLMGSALGTYTGIRITPPIKYSAATLATGYGIYIESMNGASTNAYGLYVEAPANGSTINLGIYNAGATNLVKPVLLGGRNAAPQDYIGLQLYADLTSSNSSYFGITSQARYGTSATGNVYDLYVNSSGADGTYTTATRCGIDIANFAKGTGQTLTTQYGIYVEAMTAGGTNNYGVYIAAPTGGSGTNLGLYNAGDTQLGGLVNIGGTGTNVSENVLINTTLTSTGASQYGVVVQTMPSASATANYFTMYVQPNTAAGSYTVGNVFGIYVTDAQKGAGCTITSQYGIYIAAITSATSQNWAVYSAGTAYSQFGGPIQCASYFWAFSGSYYVRMYHDGSNGQIDHSGGSLVVGSATGGIYIQPASGQHIVANLSGGGAFLPNADNSWTCGGASNRWTAVYAVNGAIQTSSRAMKHSEQALAPADALAAVMGTDYIRYQYVTRPLEDDADDDAKARHERVAAWVHTGYYAEDAHALLKLDDESVSAQNTASVALAAIKEVEMRRAALEDRIVDLEAEVTRLRKLVKAA